MATGLHTSGTCAIEGAVPFRPQILRRRTGQPGGDEQLARPSAVFAREVQLFHPAEMPGDFVEIRFKGHRHGLFSYFQRRGGFSEQPLGSHPGHLRDARNAARTLLVLVNNLEGKVCSRESQISETQPMNT